MPRRKAVRIGERFGRLTVMQNSKFRFNSKGHKIFYASVKCECGNTFDVLEIALRICKTKSCGCLQKEKAVLNLPKAIHNMTNTPTYNSWQSMKDRCHEVKHPYFAEYGGRGIKICERWLKFKNFLADMGVRPKDKTIDRINVNGGYYPENCRWSDWRTQHQNRRDNRFVIFNNEKICVAEACRRLNLHNTTLHQRAKRTKCSLQEATDFYALKQFRNYQFSFINI